MRKKKKSFYSKHFSQNRNTAEAQRSCIYFLFSSSSLLLVLCVS